MGDIYVNLNRQILVESDFCENPQTFGTALKLLNDGKQICICHCGFRFDSYMGICSHLCSYCYAMGQNMRYMRNLAEEIRIADIEDVKKEFRLALETDSEVSIEGKCIRHRYPIRCGTQTDCFQLAERKYNITYRFIDEIMNKYNYPYLVCTKNAMCAEDKYLKLYEKGNGNVAFQFTLSTLNQDYLDKIERGASTAKERLQAMKKLSSLGYRVVCRISPYIPEYMDDVEDLIKALAENGCHHVINELLRISPILNNVMLCETNYNVIDLYKKKGVKMLGGYYHYPLLEKIKVQRTIKELCDKYGMTFATCGDEDPSFHTTTMCCGLEGLKNFENVPYATYDTLYRLLEEKKEVRLEDMKQYYCAYPKRFKEKWESGYFMQVLMNAEYNQQHNSYMFTQKNSVVRGVYDMSNKKKAEQLEMFTQSEQEKNDIVIARIQERRKEMRDKPKVHLGKNKKNNNQSNQKDIQLSLF